MSLYRAGLASVGMEVCSGSEVVGFEFGNHVLAGVASGLILIIITSLLGVL